MTSALYADVVSFFDVVVPRMVKLIEEKCGTEKSIPQMILAGAPYEK